MAARQQTGTMEERTLTVRLCDWYESFEGMPAGTLVARD